MVTAFSEICRLCLRREVPLLPIFESSSGFSNKIQAVSAVVQIKVGDGLPAQICEKCAQKVEFIWKFKLQCELSDSTLRHHLKQQQEKESNKMVECCSACKSRRKECNIKAVSLDPKQIKMECMPSNVHINRMVDAPIGIGCRNCITRTLQDSVGNIEKDENGDTSQILRQSAGNPNVQKSPMKQTLFLEETLCINGRFISTSSKWTNGVGERCEQTVQSGTQSLESAKYHECVICGKLVRRLAPHMRIHTGDRPYQCSQCGQRFIQVGGLKKHQTLHSNEMPHQCLICGKCFRCKPDLSLHTKLHTGQSYDCTHCGKHFVSQRAMDNHVRIHTGEKPFLCHMCGMGFSQEGNLSMHIKVHNGEKPYHCMDCGKEFVTQTQMKRHRRIHTGERPYGCATCGKWFSDRGYLMQHQSVHSGERSYSCSVCSKTFTQHISLKRHSRLHTGEKPFECAQCGETFVLKRDLKRHSEKAHIVNCVIP